MGDGESGEQTRMTEKGGVRGVWGGGEVGRWAVWGDGQSENEVWTWPAPAPGLLNPKKAEHPKCILEGSSKSSQIARRDS